jgi:hypothetical protein
MTSLTISCQVYLSNIYTNGRTDILEEYPINKISSPVQTGPGDHPASYTMGTRSFLGVKRPGRGVDQPLSSAEVKKMKLILFIFNDESTGSCICTCKYCTCHTLNNMRHSGLLLFLLLFPYPYHHPLPHMCLRNAYEG